MGGAGQGHTVVDDSIVIVAAYRVAQAGVDELPAEMERLRAAVRAREAHRRENPRIQGFEWAAPLPCGHGPPCSPGICRCATAL